MDDKISKAINEISSEPFSWDENNCALSVAKAAEVIYDRDFSSDFKSRCKSPLSAARILKKEGGLESILKKMGFRETKASWCRRGDVVIYEFKSPTSSINLRSALGLVVDYRAMVKSKEGSILIPVRRCKSIWRLIK